MIFYCTVITTYNNDTSQGNHVCTVVQALQLQIKNMLNIKQKFFNTKGP